MVWKFIYCQFKKKKKKKIFRKLKILSNDMSRNKICSNCAMKCQVLYTDFGTQVNILQNLKEHSGIHTSVHISKTQIHQHTADTKVTNT